MASTASAAASTRPPAARIGPGPALPSGPALGARVGLAAATLDGVAVGVAIGAGVGLGEGDGLAVATGLGLGDGVGACVGGAGGGTVGGTVGGGVGAGVGGGAVVGAGPSTVTVPCMNEWNVQWYAYVPAALKVMVLLPRLGIAPVSNTPVSEVAVCSSGSLLLHVTLSRTLIVTFCGTKVKFWMMTV